jgi:hypothetical protein
MSQPINAFDLTPNEHIALDNMTEKLLDDVNVDIKEAFELVQLITQSDGLTVGEVIKFLSENLFMDLEVSPDGMTFKANDVYDV